MDGDARTAWKRFTNWYWSRGKVWRATLGVVSLLLLAASQLHAAGRTKRAPAESLPLNLPAPAVGHWRLARPLDDPNQLRLELELAPRGIPRWRFVGPAQLARDQPVTWLEFVQSKADTVLKVKLECHFGESLELTATPHFQLLPNGPVLPWSEDAGQKAERMVAAAAFRVDNQLLWLAARGGKPASAGGGRGATPGKSRSSSPGSQLASLQATLQQQKIVIGQARQRLQRLQALREKLSDGVRLELRAVRADSGEQLELQPVTAVGDEATEGKGGGARTGVLLRR